MEEQVPPWGPTASKQGPLLQAAVVGAGILPRGGPGSLRPLCISEPMTRLREPQCVKSKKHFTGLMRGPGLTWRICPSPPPVMGLLSGVRKRVSPHKHSRDLTKIFQSQG